ncbi:MAG TPA: hypothetical protein VM537_15495 [Anaerolineae bacterium]|nr:hypothetical protein [Anaerolineae bacterium]
MSNDERLVVALAKAIDKAVTDSWERRCRVVPGGTVTRPDWDALDNGQRGDVIAGARAALAHLGCVKADGEVFVPDIRRAVILIREAQFHAKPEEHARLENAALRALTGGTDGK